VFWRLRPRWKDNFETGVVKNIVCEVDLTCWRTEYRDKNFEHGNGSSCCMMCRPAITGSFQILFSLAFIVIVKGKAFPLQAWTGPWGSRRLRLQNF
jgi:hypothetical protein